MQACNQRSFKINTAESAQPRNRSIVTRPFSSWGRGLGTRLPSYVMTPKQDMGGASRSDKTASVNNVIRGNPLKTWAARIARRESRSRIDQSSSHFWSDFDAL